MDWLERDPTGRRARADRRTGLTAGPDATLWPTSVGLFCHWFFPVCYCTQGMVALTDYGTVSNHIPRRLVRTKEAALYLSA